MKYIVVRMSFLLLIMSLGASALDSPNVLGLRNIQPDRILFVSGLPKTRSGKIMRRILRKLAAGETDQLGDISTLLNPEIVEEIIEKLAKE